ncbi:ABC transporter permease [Fulvivirgaceae bacterium BMA12]|uniref:ABC transporter permease n=1 Tax=Agaribacillus aureus TaxID=3051825 RepID=A0ABT8KYZ3_9BACT|nr:ABC transporter permease [Fulvivirgaceae bacterium BMA12]
MINLMGLAAGMAVFIVIVHYVNFEMSYDQFHKNKKTLYRVAIDELDQEGELTGKYATVSPGYGPKLKNYFSDVKLYTRLAHTAPFMPKPVLSYRENKFYEDHIYYADQAFLQMFSFPLVSGDLQTALKEPKSIVISESSAKRYFGEEDPMGKILNLQMGARGAVDLKITGIMSDFPVNSHLQIDMLISFNTLPADWHLDEVLDWGDFYVYLQLQNEQSIETLTDNLPVFLRATTGEFAKSYRLVLQHVPGIHLNSNRLFEAKPTSSAELIGLLFIVAVLVLIVAWINYINLVTVKSLEYTKEVSLRKMFGASKTQLYLQQLVNALSLNFLAFLIAFSLSQLVEPYVRDITSIPIKVSLVGDHVILMSIFLVVLGGSILSGLYPALVLSQQNLHHVVKGSFLNSTNGKFTKKLLVTFQFMVSVILIAITLTVYKQMKYMQDKDLGMSIDQTLIIKGSGKKGAVHFDKWEYFANKAVSHDPIKSVAVSTNIPGHNSGWGRNLYRIDKPEQKEIPTKIIATGPDFFSLYEMGFIAGDNFPLASNSWNNSAILNEEAIKLLGYDSPEEAVGRMVAWDENNDQFVFNIIGVIRNFNQQSPKKPHMPIIFPMKKFLDPPWAGDYYSVKFKENKVGEAIEIIKDVWREVYADSPFDYFFLDAFFERQYKADRQFGKVFTIFTVLAIMVAYLGLLGLVGYTVAQKTKEIGIRRVLGATQFNILKLLSHEYIWLVGIALALAGPIAYYGANEWLQSFAYRISLGWWFYALPVLATFLMLAFTLSLQLIKTAKTNPVHALRNE